MVHPVGGFDGTEAGEVQLSDGLFGSRHLVHLLGDRDELRPDRRDVRERMLEVGRIHGFDEGAELCELPRQVLVPERLHCVEIDGLEHAVNVGGIHQGFVLS